MKYLTAFLLLFTVNAANAKVGDTFLGSDAALIFADGITVREWIVGDQINMFIRKDETYYTCSIRVENEMYGEARIWCVELG